MTLSELQALLHGRITGMVPGREDEVREQVVARAPLDALERVEIYAGMYLHRLVDAIAEDVPLTSRGIRISERTCSIHTIRPFPIRSGRSTATCFAASAG